MYPDANVSKENILYQYFWDGRPNYRAISKFYNDYGKWRSNQAQQKWNEGDADNDGVLNEFDNNDFVFSMIHQTGDPNADSDYDGIPDWMDPFPNDRTRGPEDVGVFKIEWETRNGRKIIIPIWGGKKAKEGLNVTWDADGNVKVSIGINTGGVVVEHELGSPEEVKDKINAAINNGTAKVEEIQETTVDIFKTIFGIKDKDDNQKETTVNTGSTDTNGSTDAAGSTDTNNNNNTNASVNTGSTDTNNNNTEVNPTDTNNNNTNASVAYKDQDPYEDIIKTETSVSPSLASGGGLFQGTTAEALGRFMPKEIVQPVPFARRAAAYKRPRYSLFSEYI